MINEFDIASTDIAIYSLVGDLIIDRDNSLKIEAIDILDEFLGLIDGDGKEHKILVIVK